VNSVLIEAKNLCKEFTTVHKQSVYALNDVSLAIHKNEIVGLVGESGSGKTTFGKTLIGLHDKTKGAVFFKGNQLPQRYLADDFRRQASQIQMVFQDPYSSLNPRMTIQEIIAEGLRLQHGKSLSDTRDKVVEILEDVGLNASHLSRYPHEFSGGQRQRVGIARALIVEPELLICDEPISALDVSVQAQIIKLLAEVKHSMNTSEHESQGLSMLFIAHDLSMVRYISDTMAVMYLGSLIEIGPADEIYFNPLHPYTQKLIESNPHADPQRERQRKESFLQGEIPSPVNIPKGCCFAGRCPHAEKRCHETRPVLSTLSNASLKHHKAFPGETNQKMTRPREIACHLVADGTLNVSL
jgi:oligopeptide/dipeptide ABC transporter ATP-binding protein